MYTLCEASRGSRFCPPQLFWRRSFLRPDIFTLLGFFPVLIVTNTQRTRPQTFVSQVRVYEAQIDSRPSLAIIPPKLETEEVAVRTNEAGWRCGAGYYEEINQWEVIDLPRYGRCQSTVGEFSK